MLSLRRSAAALLVGQLVGLLAQEQAALLPPAAVPAPSLCVVQFEERSDAEAGRALPALNAQSCAAVPGCRHLYSRRPAEVEPHWQKVLEMQRALEVERCGVALWLDTDAVLASNTSIVGAVRLLGEEHDMLISPDTHHGGHPDPFNAGVWAVRDTPTSRQILRYWMRRYRADAWWKDGARPGWNWGYWKDGTRPAAMPVARQQEELQVQGTTAQPAADPQQEQHPMQHPSWSCHRPHGASKDYCNYLGMAWEQTAFSFDVLPRFRDAIKVAESDVLNNPTCLSAADAVARGVLVCHFFGDFEGGFRHLASAYLASRVDLPPDARAGSTAQ